VQSQKENASGMVVVLNGNGVTEYWCGGTMVCCINGRLIDGAMV